MMKATTIYKFDHFTKRLWVVFAFILFTIHGAFAQCPPGDVTLNTQAQVDNFIVQYPGCTVITGNVSILDELAESGITNLNGLRNITSITGDLVVFGNVNLDGLPALSHIGGSLHILQNQKLQNINGFAALTSIGGRISISQNRALTKLDGFAALTDIGGYVSISENHALTNIDGFAALTEIGSFLSISKNHALTNIDGFPALTTIGSLVSISENQALTNIKGFAALTTIDGEVWINQNLVLTEISGLQNIDPATIRGLSITGNILLSVCNLPNFCAYLANDPATHPRTISGNAGACGDEAAIIAACNAATAGCPIGHMTFTSQAAIDQFILDYPTCTEIAGNITISGNDITNLDGLRNIISITGHLDVLSNAALVNLDGFAALTTIGGFVSINLNPALNKIDGFATLKTIGGEVFIAQNQTLTNIDGFAGLTTIGGPLQILENQALTKIDGFSTLTTIGGFLNIDRNQTLTNIDGFEALKTIGGELTINTNTALTNIDGFAALTDIGGYLLIGFNPALINIDGFSALETIDGDVFISQNQALTKIDGFAALTTIGGSLSIYQNQALTDISALQNIDPSTIRGLSITGNILLSVCNLPNFCTYLANDRATHPRAIIGNAGDCGDEAAIIAACNGATTGCPTGDLTFDSQAAIDQFIIDYPSCTEITGNVTISGEDITNLDGLRNIISITGSLAVVHNIALVSLDGFAALTTIGGWVSIDFNQGLTNIDGFAALTAIGGVVSINLNPALNKIDGFASLTDIEGEVFINQNQALANIAAFAALTTIGGPLQILENQALTKIDGFSTLTTIGGFLTINRNQSLTNIDGFEALKTIGGELSINRNQALTDISALQNIDISTIENLLIFDNPLLSVCNLPNICTYLANDPATHPRFIIGNGGNCGDEAAIIAACNGAAAGCPIGDVILNTQAEVDNFIIQYPDCTVITGNVTIESSPHFQQNMITNLDGLRNITSIEGNLSIGSYRNENVIQFSAINNLNGLSNLTSVGGDLIIKQDIGLVNIDGLSSLTFVGGDMDIFSIHALTTIDGFSALTAIGGDIRIRQNPALTKIDGFAALTTIGGDIRIDQNQALMDIDGFAALTTIGGGIRLNENQALTNIDEFAALTTIGGDIWIYRTALTKIDGFATLTTIGGDFTISQNQTLTNIDGFAALTSIGRGLYFISNPVLGNINGFTALTTIGGFLDFSQSQALTRIDGFTALTTIGTGLSIYQNQALTDISALQNIDISTIENLFIIDNPLLSVCNLPNICTYLANDPVTHPRAISGNAGNCGDEAAIIAACNGATAGCPIGNLILDSQAAIDQFIIDYPTCTEITGSVTIFGEDITNLDGLRNITNISAQFRISYAPALTSISGLAALTSIGGDFILSNTNLIHLNGLNALKSVGGQLNIAVNQSLISLDGMDELSSVGTFIRITYNDALTNIDALASLVGTISSLDVSDNMVLANLHGLANITSIRGAVTIENNDALISLNGLEAGLTNMVVGLIRINDNTALTDISALQNIDPSILRSLSINNNPLLSICNLPNICTYLANDPATHPRTISGNAGDCGDEAAIIAACNGCAPGMDSQAPEITCIGNQIVKTLEGESTYVHRGTDWDAVAADNCMVASVEYVLSGATTGNGASLDGVVFNAGLSTVSWTVTDGNGNTAVCSFTVTVEITEVEIVKEDITGITFANSSFVYDSTVKSLTITGDLPAGTSVSYTINGVPGNSATVVGSYALVANITGGDNYHDLTLTGTLEITKAAITGITFTNGSFVYDGTSKSLAITGSLPAGNSLSYTINGVPGNSATVVGSYALVANIAGGDNYHDLTLTATLEIAKAAITGITLTNGSFVYDGTSKSLAITGSLPAGTSLSYLIDGSAANSVTNAGTYSVTANISGGDNYHDLTLTATLQITKANQQINHNIPAEVQRSAGSIPVSVTSSSGLTVSISEDDPQIARVIGNNLQILQMGTVRITLSQSGNENYQAAQPVTVTLRVVDMEEADLPVKIHQALSPNGDGINDQLIIEGIKDYPENKVTILSRNGTIVYQAERYNNDNIAFTGSSINGLKLPAGTYFYIVEIKVDGAWKYKKSFFVLRR